ncbi:unnamed protein product [Phytophthora lilii]|uniref:Unnamed protein product n=1 Tax=Phytophthora lilii TaxID=2077276 RepID=A0A9W6U335_9STRA|nr:unnamed protein product [Phytophthora lilii]
MKIELNSSSTRDIYKVDSELKCRCHSPQWLRLNGKDVRLACCPEAVRVTVDKLPKTDSVHDVLVNEMKEASWYSAGARADIKRYGTQVVLARLFQFFFRRRCRVFIFFALIIGVIPPAAKADITPTFETTMSFKPELFEDEEGKKLPLANEDELFILQRAKITFQCKTPE